MTESAIVLRAPSESPREPRSRPRTRPVLMLLAILIASGAAIISGMLTTSTTFDEIVFMAGGARGYATGDWGIAPEHPPLMQYLYGLPIHLLGPNHPAEEPVAQRGDMGYRYRYAQRFFWSAGNDPEKLAFAGRLPAVACAMALITLVFAFVRRSRGMSAALLAALMVAALPDVLGHGGVAYNDVPVALAILASVWALDRAIRSAAVRDAIVAGILTGLALTTKNTAIALAPIAVLILACEAVSRRRDRWWWKRVSGAAAIALAGMYVTLVVVYRGDVLLAEYRYSIEFALRHTTKMAVPSFLLGQNLAGGRWYFFPVAFLFKTSAAFQLLMVLGLSATAVRAFRARRVALGSSLRAPAIAMLVLLVLLVRADLNIGFRYALPIMPFVVILAAAGIVHLWPTVGRVTRVAIVAAVAWSVIHVGSYHPNYLSYISEYGPDRESLHEVLVDSSLDWGQGLLALRDAMREEGIEKVYLSYFGSALPEGYGIDYVPLPSFFPLPQRGSEDDVPTWLAVSATSLQGTYLVGDPFRDVRTKVRPDRVVANTIYLYNLGGR